MDSLGVLDFEWLWAILDPEADSESGASLADQFVELCTSWVGISIDTMAKSEGKAVEDYDMTDKKNVTNVKILSYALLHSNMYPATFLSGAFGFWSFIFFLITPDSYADENGLAKSGWPEIIARTV